MEQATVTEENVIPMPNFRKRELLVLRRVMVAYNVKGFYKICQDVQQAFEEKQPVEVLENVLHFILWTKYNIFSPSDRNILAGEIIKLARKNAK